MNATAPRYYAKPSPTQSGTWNVLDRSGRAPEGGHAVEAAHLTYRQAMAEAQRLNNLPGASVSCSVCGAPDCEPGDVCGRDHYPAY